MRETAPSNLTRPGPASRNANVERGRLGNIERGQRIATPNARLPNNASAPGRPGAPAQAAVPQQAQRPSDNARRTVGVAPGTSQRQMTAAERQRFEEARRVPILRNAAFAGAPINRTRGEALSRATFRGAFAESPFMRDHRRHDHRRFGVVLGFIGPVFWPYAYTDFVDYTFSPYAYDTFWPYAFDDVYAGMFGGYAPEYYAADDVYAYAGTAASERSYARFAGATPRQTTASATESRICSGQAQDITGFSIDKIAQQVQPDQDQQALLDQLKDATVKAVNVLQDACPTELPSTPTGRLDGMLTRVNAMLQAVQIVRPALDKFYQSLNDEQRERFNTLDQQVTADRTQRSDLARLCDSRATSAGSLPTSRIERSLKLSSDQEAGLKALEDASAGAADALKANCQQEETLTPTGRLAAMEERLSAMSKALTGTRTALTNFYGSLSDEQKARFDRMPLRTS